MDDKTIMGLLGEDLHRILGELDEWAKSVEAFDDDTYQALAQRLWSLADTLSSQSKE